MAQLPTIASTANRRILPSADLRVEGVSPAAFGAAVGAGLQQIGDAGADVGKAVQQFQLAKQEETNRLAEFDRQTTYVAFSSGQATKLEEARRDLSGPAQDFTKTVMAGFDSDAAAFLEKIPERERHAWQARMAQLRSSVAGQALSAEFGQRDSYYKAAVGDTLGHLENGAMSSPDQLPGFKTQGEQLIDASGMSAQDKLEAKLRWRAQVTISAGQGDLDRDPEGAIVRFGGVLEPTSAEAAGKIGGGGVAGLARTIGQLESGNRDFTSSGAPVTSAVGAKYRMQVMPATAAKPGFGIAPAASDTPAEYNRVGEQLLAALTQKYDGDVAKIAAAYHSGSGTVDKAVAAGGDWVKKLGPEGRDYVKKALAATGGAPAAAAVPLDPNAPAPEVDPRYADLPASARAQLIGAAQRKIQQREQVQTQAEQKAHDDWLNQFMNDLNDGKAGTADIDAARKSGTLVDFDEISRAQNVVEVRTKKTEALNLYNTVMAGGGQFNPYDDKTKDAVNAAFTAQIQVPGANPLRVATNIWQRTGVLPEAGATMLRGGLVSTDANTVAMAASVASNMLDRNPNAFAGMQGGNDIEQAAALYSHYVNDLGLNAQEAAQRVAQRNAPEVRRKVDVNKPATDAFRAKLRKTDAGNLLSNAFGGWFSVDPEFTAPGQKLAAAQDYADFAADHYEQHGDEGAAQTYAMSQMKKLYGAVNGRLMKFPPTRTYPEVRGSKAYIFQQAQEFIKGATGRDIPANQIYFMPIRTATAEAFRAGKPTPYEIHYLDKVEGHDVHRAIPGRAFVADVGRAQREAAGEFGRERDKARLEASEARRAPSLAEVRAANPRQEGEGTFAYSQRVGALQWEAQTQLNEDKARYRGGSPAAKQTNAIRAQEWERHYPRGPNESAASYNRRNPYRN